MTIRISPDLVITDKMVSTPVEQWDNTTFSDLSVDDLKRFRDNIAAIAEHLQKRKVEIAEREKRAEEQRLAISEQIRATLNSIDARVAHQKALRKAEVLSDEIKALQRGVNQQQKTLNYLNK